jgi:ribosome-binding factor A
MNNKKIRDIKHAQKAALWTREIANLFRKLSLDRPELQGIYVNRVKLSPDGGLCNIYFCAHGGKAEFDAKLGELILYKPSMRASLAKIIHSRYTPDLVFRYDEEFEKQERVNALIDRLKDEGKL